MKTLMTITLFMILLTGSAFTEVDKYVAAMQEKIQTLYAAQTAAELQEAVNGIDRIAQAEKTKWEPFYYVSFGYILMATRETDGGKKDALLDLAQHSLDQAKALRKDDSEVVALEGFVHTIRLTVDPATRGPKYAGLAMQTFQNALALSPENPRAMMLMAQMQFGTAAFFKQKPVEGCESAAKAVTLYENDKSGNLLAPRWGKESALELVKNCQ